MITTHTSNATRCFRLNDSNGFSTFPVHDIQLRTESSTPDRLLNVAHHKVGIFHRFRVAFAFVDTHLLTIAVHAGTALPALARPVHVHDAVMRINFWQIDVELQGVIGTAANATGAATVVRRFNDAELLAAIVCEDSTAIEDTAILPTSATSQQPQTLTRQNSHTHEYIRTSVE